MKTMSYSVWNKCLGNTELKLKQVALLPTWSAGKESACNAGDPSSIPGSGRSAGEGIGYPLQYSWISLVTQLVKNPPAMAETWVRSLHWEDLLEKGKATTPVFWPREFHGLQSIGSQRVWHDWVTFTFTGQMHWSCPPWIPSKGI